MTAAERAHWETADLRRSILRLVWPAATENLLQLTVGLVNLAIVGRLGAEALGAVGLANRLVQIVWALFLAFSTGAVIRVAQATGAKRPEVARHTAEQALAGAALFVLFLVLALLAGAESFLAAFRPAPAVIAAGAPYVRILACGMPLFTFMLVTGAVLRGAGDTRTPMLIALGVNVLNIVGNYLLIFGRLGLPALGLRGSALATVIAQTVGAATALAYLSSPQSRVRISLAGLGRLHLPAIADVFLLGLPNALETLAWQVAAVFLTGVIITHGTTALAGYQVGLTVEGLSYLPAAAFYIAATASVGQSLGAGDVRLARRYVQEIMRWNVVFTVAVALMLLVWPERLVRLLTRDAGVVAVSALYLRYMAFAQLPQNVAGVLNGALRGAGHTRPPLVAMATGLWGVRLPLAFLLTRTWHLGLPGIWTAILADLGVRLGLSFLFYRQRRWEPAALPTPACGESGAAGDTRTGVMQPATTRRPHV